VPPHVIDKVLIAAHALELTACAPSSLFPIALPLRKP
jgi:hypothetical protein